jgi:hypothetical protein
MVKFVENGHYYVNSKGVIIPSVSDLVSFHFPNTYDKIPKSVLDAAAEYGTFVHELLEQYDNGELDVEKLQYSHIDPNAKSSVKQYAELKKKYTIYPKSQEVIVDYHERYAGRYDKLDNANILWDVKTTSKKYEDKWACQLGYYYLALGYEKEVAYVIWLPKKEKGEIILIKPWTNEECEKGLAEYEKHIADGKTMLGVW